MNKKLVKRIYCYDMFYILAQILVSKLILYPFLMSWTPRQNVFLEVNMWAVCDKDLVFICNQLPSHSLENDRP